MTTNGALKGKTALVTGASGGIGSAIARALARHGCALALHFSSNRAGAEALLREIKDLGGSAQLFKGDLLKTGVPDKLAKEVLKAFGRVDILINNAGAVIDTPHFTELTEESWDKTFRLNALAPFLLTRAFFPHMEKNGGRVINISSIAAKFGGSARSMHYGAAKAALEALTASLSREGAPRGILVNAVRAGVIDTPFHQKFRKNMDDRIKLIPLRRMGRPEDVAELIAFLCGPGGDYITGQVLPVTGGE